MLGGGALNLGHMQEVWPGPHADLLHPFYFQLHQLITLWLAVQCEADNEPPGLINPRRLCRVISNVLG